MADRREMTYGEHIGFATMYMIGCAWCAGCMVYLLLAPFDNPTARALSVAGCTIGFVLLLLVFIIHLFMAVGAPR